MFFHLCRPGAPPLHQADFFKSAQRGGANPSMPSCQLQGHAHQCEGVRQLPTRQPSHSQDPHHALGRRISTAMGLGGMRDELAGSKLLMRG